MTANVADFVQETTTTTGLGSYSLGGAVAGHQTFAAGIGNATACYYAATDGSNWEVGIGTVTTGSPDVLSRTTILASSTGAAINWAAGTKFVYVTHPASRTLLIDTANSTILNLPDPVTIASTLTPTTARGKSLGSTSLPWSNIVGKTLYLNDSDNSNYMKLVAGANLTADRTLTVTTTDADTTLTIAGTSASISGTNTGDQTVTLTGDVTGSGTGSFAATIAGHAVTNAKFRQGVGTSVVGVTGSSTADVADIAASADKQVLWRSGTTLAFAAFPFANLSSIPTTLAGYGITDALSNATNSTQDGHFGDVYLFDDTSPSHYLQITVAENLTAARALSIVTGDASRTLTFAGNATISGTNTGDQTITLTGDATGSGTGSFATTLATVNSNVGSFTNANITVNAKGLVTAAASGSAGGAAALTRVAKTSGYTVVAGDLGKVIDCTSGTFTLAFTAAATLGDGFYFYVVVSGSGLITLDPNAAETINGQSTLPLSNGQTVLVVCDASNFKLIGAEFNPLSRFTSTVTTATTLTASSAALQIGNMSTASQSYTLPDATTLSVGVLLYTFNNIGDYSFGIRDSGGTLQAVVNPGGTCAMSLSANGSAAGTWAANGSGLSPFLVIGDNTPSSTYTTSCQAQVELSATKAAMFVRDASGFPYVVIVDHSAYPATFGTITLIRSVNADIVAAYMITASKLMVALASGHVYNISVSGTTPTMSVVATTVAMGPAGAFNQSPFVAQLSTTLYIGMRSNGGTLGVQAVDCSATDPSAGAEVTGSTTVKQLIGIFPTSATAAIVLYIDDSGSGGTPFSIRGLVASTSGTTVTLNASAGLNDVTADPGAGLSWGPVAAPGATSATAFAVMYMNSSDSDMYLLAFTVSGTTTTAGTGNKIEAGTFVNPIYTTFQADKWRPNVFGLDTTHVLVTYSDNSQSSRHVVAALSSTTFSYGTPLYGLWNSTNGSNFPQIATGFLCVQYYTSLIQQVENITISGTTLTYQGTDCPTGIAFSGGVNSFGLSGGYYGICALVNSAGRSKMAFYKRRPNGNPQFLGMAGIHNTGWPAIGQNTPVELAANRFGFCTGSQIAYDGVSSNDTYVRLIIGEVAALGASP